MKRLDSGRDGLTEEQRTIPEQYLFDYSEKDIPKEKRVDCEQAVFELQGRLAAFETEFSLEDLRAIIDLTAAEAPNHLLREPAKKFLFPLLQC